MLWIKKKLFGILLVAGMFFLYSIYIKIIQLVGYQYKGIDFLFFVKLSVFLYCSVVDSFSKITKVLFQFAGVATPPLGAYCHMPPLMLFIRDSYPENPRHQSGFDEDVLKVIKPGI